MTRASRGERGWGLRGLGSIGTGKSLSNSDFSRT
jgi:hypothetical protein